MSANTDYIQSYIGGLSGTFGWNTDVLNFIVSETMEDYGVTDEADMTDTKKTHALLKYNTAERMMVEASANMDYRADGESFNASQAFAQIKTMYQQAYVGAFPYLPEDDNENVQSLQLGTSPYRRSSLSGGEYEE